MMSIFFFVWLLFFSDSKRSCVVLAYGSFLSWRSNWDNQSSSGRITNRDVIFLCQSQNNGNRIQCAAGWVIQTHFLCDFWVFTCGSFLNWPSQRIWVGETSGKTQKSPLNLISWSGRGLRPNVMFFRSAQTFFFCWEFWLFFSEHSLGIILLRYIPKHWHAVCWSLFKSHVWFYWRISVRGF